MKINIEIDLSPEELRRFMGLPDVQGVQQQMIERMTETLQSSSTQQEEFFRAIFSGAMTPWQRFFEGPRDNKDK